MLASFAGIVVGAGTLVAAVSAASWAKKAAEETERSANSAEEGLTHSREISRAQLRPYLFVDKIEMMPKKENPRLYEIKIVLKNSGITPARNIAVRTNAYLTNDSLMLKAFKRADQWMTAGAAAPSNVRLIFDGIYVGDDALKELKGGNLQIVLRLQYRYTDSGSGKFSESYDYYMDAAGYESAMFYLLTPDQIRRMRRNEPGLFEGQPEPKKRRKN